MYHSARDPVLKVAYRVGALDRALGFKGPEDRAAIEKSCPEVFVVDCSAVVSSHGGYRSSAEVYSQWSRVMAESALPRFDRVKKQQ